MLEQQGDLFGIHCDAVAVTTNGFVKANGECVMGKGCAAEVAKMFPSVPKKVGTNIRLNGNKAYWIMTSPTGVALMTFPVKPECKFIQVEEDLNYVVKHMRHKFKVNDVVPGWACVADIEIIKKSAMELKDMADTYTFLNKILIPRAGCGAGELDWKDVRPVLADILDDRFVAVTF